MESQVLRTPYCTEILYRYGTSLHLLCLGYLRELVALQLLTLDLDLFLIVSSSHRLMLPISSLSTFFHRHRFVLPRLTSCSSSRASNIESFHCSPLRHLCLCGFSTSPSSKPLSSTLDDARLLREVELIKSLLQNQGSKNQSSEVLRLRCSLTVTYRHLSSPIIT